MNHDNTNTETSGGRWLRVSLLTLTMVAPIVNSIMDYFRKRAELDGASTADQVSSRQRLDELTYATRQRAGAQAQQLQNWAQDWSQDLRKRGEDLAEDLAAQSGKISQDLLARGSKVTRDITKRGSRVQRDITKRGRKVTRRLAKRSKKLSQDLTERSNQLLQPNRKRNSTFWTIFGFSLGMVIAAVVTYLLIRKRLERQALEAEQQFELSQVRSGERQGEQGKPAGEIIYMDNEGAVIATVEAVDLDTGEVVAPADAAFVGVVGTKRYYPIEVTLDDGLELVYFVSEDEARAQGYSVAE
ncbi:MAG: hypothetical protein E6J31_07150 [Chloroflexi bacterium]|nr:MAG: hypothetical protein E6J31_07150 [Chloroflexota bacterium]TMC93895.1 MAG: hypothetical protein E6J11_16390 [Chloroflexota bacterium]TMD66792.1 MAG: hypothetical protein E6I97_23720 [Chloroflexota bacterium]